MGKNKTEIDDKKEYSAIQIEELLGDPLNEHESKHSPETIFYSGSMEIPIPQPRVSIIGSRNASERGITEAKDIAAKLVENEVVIVSGLARGIDTAAHKTAIEKGGKTIAVLGTPLNKTSPKENSELQDKIMRDHLAISQYPIGHNTRRRDFVFRNRTMALISNATVIVEADESSGSLHQGHESIRIGRPLYISKNMVDDKKLEWPKKMLNSGAIILDDPLDILYELPSKIRVTFEMLEKMLK